MVAFPAEIIFKAKDQASGVVKTMGRNVNRTMRMMQARVDRFDASLNKLGGTAAGAFGALGMAGGIFAVQSAMRSAIVTGADFEQTLVNAAAKFPGEIRRGTESFLELQQAAEEVGRTTIFSASQAAEGLNFLAMAGFNAEKSIAALPVVTQLAIASQTDLGEATDIASDALGAFGLASDDATTQAANLSRIVDVMARTTTSANTDMRGLFETIKEGAPVATSAGQSLETFSALAGELANAGIKGSQAGTTLKNVFLNLSAPGTAAAAILKRLGVQTKTASGDMRDVVDIFGDLGRSLDGLGTADRSGVLEQIFGKIPIAGVNVLLQAGSDRLRDYRKRLEDSEGAAAEMAHTMGDTIKASSKTFMSSVESVGLGLFGLNRGAIAETIESATIWVRTIDNAIRSNQELGQEMSGNLFDILKGGVQVLGGFVAGMVALKTAVFAVRSAIAVYNVALGTYKVVTIAAALATKGFSIAFNLANLAFKASPIGAIVGGVSLLVAGATALITNWSSVKEFFSNLWSGILSGLNFVMSALEGLGLVGSGISGLSENISKATQKTSASVSSPEARTARGVSHHVQTNRTEVTIADQTGRASLTGPSVPGVRVIDTARAF